MSKPKTRRLVTEQQLQPGAYISTADELFYVTRRTPTTVWLESCRDFDSVQLESGEWEKVYKMRQEKLHFVIGRWWLIKLAPQPEEVVAEAEARTMATAKS